MAFYKVKAFGRFARQNGIPDSVLFQAAQEVLDGSYEADLGGGVFKKRVARDGGGKSGGYRTFVTHKTSDHLFFVYGFPKSQRDNIDEKEEKALKKMAKEFGKLTQAQIEEAIAAGEISEIEDDDEGVEEAE
ncbi:type II toxin-antitoxin system RelE/ParE family toxin [Thermomonas aquatica]|uniref:Type II toxin-antitoxin system RelE/ParE family toxin n=1 Tax=Thermomonas aquatica TaxID=2202149 RepID=A0A5B7ZM27_9GAMM|nr:type II toxin-antitoxin system RelE/ParE family toxin [Thermomonas aquatica]QDA56018.1 type II toxin-antitoxin system RelE/ParE family toxin [Thermomonas aquatica]